MSFILFTASAFGLIICAVLLPIMIYSETLGIIIGSALLILAVFLATYFYFHVPKITHATKETK